MDFWHYFEKRPLFLKFHPHHLSFRLLFIFYAFLERRSVYVIRNKSQILVKNAKKTCFFHTNKFFILVHPQVTKKNSAFFELRTVFGSFLGTVVKNAKHKKVVICRIILASILGSVICVFPKCTSLGPHLNRRGLVWYFLNSSKAQALLQILPAITCQIHFYSPPSMFMDILRTFQIVWKISKHSRKFLETLKNFQSVPKVSKLSGKFPEYLESVWRFFVTSFWG